MKFSLQNVNKMIVENRWSEIRTSLHGVHEFSYEVFPHSCRIWMRSRKIDIHIMPHRICELLAASRTFITDGNISTQRC
jgi:hypothetical protein